jgi:predicted nucleic acid-binding protein
MNGSRYLLDTNAIAAVLQGNKSLLRSLSNADWVGISVISQIEIMVLRA